ncbi:adenylate/guanylate cyclase domain-containing protein [Microvirga sp. 0TCS3.31]
MDRQEHKIERRLAAIFAADVAGYSRLMSQDEVGTLRTLTAHRQIMDRLIAEHGGRIANTAGDSVLAEFPSAVDAVQCAVEVQNAFAATSQNVPEECRLHFRIGVHVGDVMVSGGDLLGDSVNIAARLESMADPTGICLSEAAYGYVRKALPLSFTDLGLKKVKNIEEPIRAYALKVSSPTPAQADQAKRLPLPDKPSIAVLPFTNMSGDPEQEYFVDGISEDLLTALSRIRWLFVTARNSTFAYKGKPTNVKQIGRELGVRYVLEGSVRRAGSRLRVTAQLIEAEHGGHIWAERYDRDILDLFEVQDEIASSVAGAIEPQLVAAEANRVERRLPNDLKAWECTVRAVPYISRLSVEAMERAQEWLQRAIDLDPEYAYPQALMGWSYMKLWGSVGTDRQPHLITLAQQYARAATLLDDQEPWVHLVSGVVHVRRREPDAAITALNRAINLNPNFALAYAYLGYALGTSGQPHAGLEAVERSARLSPRDPFLAADHVTIRAMTHFAAGNYEDVIKLAWRHIQDGRDHIGAHRLLATSYAQLGRQDEARASLEEVLRLQPSFRVSEADRFSVFSGSDAKERYIEGLRKAGLQE